MNTKRIVVANRPRSNLSPPADYCGDDFWKITKVQDSDLYSFEWRDHKQAPWKVIASNVDPITLFECVRAHFADEAGEDVEQVDLRGDISNALLRTIYGNARGDFRHMKAANSGPSLEERLKAELTAGEITPEQVDQIKKDVEIRKRRNFLRIAREQAHA